MRTLIRGARVFDGGRTTEQTDVLIDGGLIRNADGSRAHIEIDGSGRTLVPGLIDAHTHTFDGSLEQALRYGVTTELDMFCLPANLARQRTVAAERDDVADIRSAGILATAPGGNPIQLMAGLSGSAVDAHGGQFPTLTPGIVAALVEAAHGAGLQAIAHMVTKRDTETALDAGVDVLAHVFCDAHPDDPATQRLAARIAGIWRRGRRLAI